MFGIMRPESCCSSIKTDTNYEYHRMHYCGTCKAIGKQFDQGSRMMLNYDTVFLSELLSQLNKEALNSWDKNLQKVNTCFSMPQTEDLPFSLSYSATASVLLAELKVDDNIKDSNRGAWKLLRRFYSKAFKKASAQFEKLGIDLSPVYKWIREQDKREKSNQEFNTLESCLDYYSEATAEICAQIFDEGGKRLRQPVKLHELGYHFGRLMYTLDAFEDYEQDVFKGQFNPLAEYWDKDRSMDNDQQERVRALILALQERVTESISELALEESIQRIFCGRLESNLAMRIYRERIIPSTIKERIVARWNKAKEFAGQVTCTPHTWIRQMNYYMIVLAVFISPQTSEYLPQDGKMEVFKWSAFITATLAGIGIAGVIRRKSRKERRKEKRREKRMKRFMRKLKNIFFRRNSCCTGCLDACCSGCCESCCESIFKSDNPWLWLLILLIIILVTALVLLILFLAGVI
jgi:hypothetical protein